MDRAQDKSVASLGERKHATVLFSDVSGFTALSQALDPEDLREITSRILAAAARAIEAYEGRVEKIMGDAVLGVFGVPLAHEDDAVRAVRAALDIHAFVDALGEDAPRASGREIRMHSGVNTGLVVTGEMNPARGSESLLGDAVNVASRLTSLAGPGEIVVGEETWRFARTAFLFEELGERSVRGRAGTIRPFRLVPGGRPAPSASRRHSRLVGREQELEILRDALHAVSPNSGAVVGIRGEAGTGKSRLVAEFRESLSDSGTAWHEGKTYSYAQGIPYFPFRDLLGRMWDIAEYDTAEAVRRKVDDGVRRLLGDDPATAAYIGSLFGITTPQLEALDPESAKTRIEAAIVHVLRSVAERGTTVIHFEDLHWGDTASLSLVRRFVTSRLPGALLLCVSRLSIDVLDDAATDGEQKVSRIVLSDLTEVDSRAMLSSLFGEDAVDESLCNLLLARAEGNPFFLEETVNSLLDRQLLSEGPNGWKLEDELESVEIPTTIQGVIAARIDRLPLEAKRALGEASVIGRRFRGQVLAQAAERPEDVDRSLGILIDFDLIRPVGDPAEEEYAFRHVLVQDVAYEGLLRADRVRIHELVGRAIEQLFSDRLADFDEVLALHFSMGGSEDKALHYLVRSGTKALARCALDEAHVYYSRAYALVDREQRSPSEDVALIDLVNRWAYVYWYKQDNAGLLELLTSHWELAESGSDPQRKGMFLSWLGMALWGHMQHRKSYEVLHKALDLGREADDPAVIGYAHARLAILCSDMGLLDEAVAHGDQAMSVSLRVNDGDLYSFSRCYAAVAWLYKGDIPRVRAIADDLLDYAERHTHNRSLSMGYFDMGLWCLGDGDNVAAVEWFRKVAQVSEDPLYTLFPGVTLGMASVFAGLYDEAAEILLDAFERSRSSGLEFLACMAERDLGAVRIAQGQMSQGMHMLEHARHLLRAEECFAHYAVAEVILASVFAEMATTRGVPPLRQVVRNLPFLLRYVPRASRLAEEHFRRAAETFRSIGSVHLTSWSNLALGEFYVAEGRTQEARPLLEEALVGLEACGIATDSARARALLRDLGDVQAASAAAL